jgi:hypothetical protein
MVRLVLLDEQKLTAIVSSAVVKIDCDFDRDVTEHAAERPGRIAASRLHLDWTRGG